MNPPFRPASLREAAIIDAMRGIADGYADEPDNIPEPANRERYIAEALAEVDEEFPAPPPIKVSIRHRWLWGSVVTVERPGYTERRTFDDPAEAEAYAAKLRTEASDENKAIRLRADNQRLEASLRAARHEIDRTRAEANRYRGQRDELAGKAAADLWNLSQRLIAERDAMRDQVAFLRAQLDEANERNRLSREARERAERQRIKGRDSRGRFAAEPAPLPRVEV
jgi:hypothetical protein